MWHSRLEQHLVAVAAICERIASWLPIVPLGTKSAASLPASSATRRCSAWTVGIVAEHVVADLGLGHGAAHAGGRPGHGVGAQIDRLRSGCIVGDSSWVTDRAACRIRFALTRASRAL